MDTRVWLTTPLSSSLRSFASLFACLSLVLASSSLVGCAAFEEPCPARPTPCRNDARVQVDLGPSGAITDPLVAYRLTIEVPAGKDAAGVAHGAITQRCLFSTPQNLVRCDTGPFVAYLSAPARGSCTTTPPDIGVNGDGAIVVDPPESSCRVDVEPLTLELSSNTLPEGAFTLILERNDETFLPLSVEAAVLETRPDGPRCGTVCRERVAPLTLADLSHSRGAPERGGGDPQ